MRITIQTERLLVMSSRRSFCSLCEACGFEVRMVTIDQAAILARVWLRSRLNTALETANNSTGFERK